MVFWLTRTLLILIHSIENLNNSSPFCSVLGVDNDKPDSVSFITETPELSRVIFSDRKSYRTVLTEDYKLYE